MEETNMNRAYLLIGGNQGNRTDYLARAVEAIEEDCGKVMLRSSLYETSAWGLEDQPAFLNQAVLVETELKAQELLRVILSIEEKLGRRREKRYGPRTLDIDILFFNDAIIQEPGLTVPHPEMQNRRFALVCLNEIAAGHIHPVLKMSVQQLLAACTDPLSVNKIN